MSNIVLPIFDKFDHERPIGQIALNPDILPKHLDWKLELGYRVLEVDKAGKVTGYEPVCFSIINEKEIPVEV